MAAHATTLFFSVGSVSHSWSSGWLKHGSSCYYFVFSVGSVSHSCSSGWLKHGSSCYYFVLQVLRIIAAHLDGSNMAAHATTLFCRFCES